jgi:hypothetical protein
MNENLLFSDEGLMVYQSKVTTRSQAIHYARVKSVCVGRRSPIRDVVARFSTIFLALLLSTIAMGLLRSYLLPAHPGLHNPVPYILLASAGIIAAGLIGMALALFAYRRDCLIVITDQGREIPLHFTKEKDRLIEAKDALIGALMQYSVYN